MINLKIYIYSKILSKMFAKIIKWTLKQMFKIG